VERGGGDSEDTADAKGSRRGCALEGLSESEEEVVGVYIVCIRAQSRSVSLGWWTSYKQGQTVDRCHSIT